MSLTRTLDAVMASAVAGLPASLPPALPPALPADDTLDLRDLVGKTVATIDAYQFGWRMRFTDGALICINADCTFDRVGNFVKEPQ